MIQRVYERARTAKHLDRLIIATDDERISQAAQNFGAEVQMTSPSHNSGTERAAEVAKKIKASIIINIQGDEPLLRGEMIDDLVESLQDETIPMATLITKVKDLNILHDTNIVKVIRDKEGFALYFSREPIPSNKKEPNKNYMYKQVCIIPFTRDFLIKFNQLEPTSLEIIESIDMLRVLEHGFKVKMVLTKFETYSVDTINDLKRVVNLMKKDKLMKLYIK